MSPYLALILINALFLAACVWMGYKSYKLESLFWLVYYCFFGTIHTGLIVAASWSWYHA